MQLNGYGSQVTLDDDSLLVEATNAVARRALGAASRLIPLSEISAVSFRPAGPFINGQLKIQSSVGVTLIHFLRKSTEAARSIHEVLLALPSVDGTSKPAGRFANERAAARDQAFTRRMTAWRERQDAQFAEWQARSTTQRDAMRAEIEARRGQRSAHRGELSTAELRAMTAALGAAEREMSPLTDPTEVEAIDMADPVAVEEAVRVYLDLAAEAGRVGDVVGEERNIALALAYAKKHGTRPERSAARLEVSRREASGRLRPGSTPIGEVRGEGGFAQWSRRQSLSSVDLSGERRIIIRSDRVVSGGSVRPLDEFVSAQVYLDGQQQITQRPTLTRMALLSPLPGSALIAGFALQKKTVHDMRVAEFQIGSVGWSMRASIAPSTVNSARQIAEQVNRIATMLEKHNAADVSAPTPSTEAVLAQLERVAYLVEQGVMTADEAGALRSAILAP